MTSELKPCPFCGGKAGMVNYGLTGRLRIVQCLDCGARTRAFDPEVKRGESACDEWNRGASAQPDDLISRRSAIKALQKNTNYALAKDGTLLLLQDSAISAIEELPSIQPEQKKARWETVKANHNGMIHCSNCCADWWDKRFKYVFAYCPNCGAKMER